MKPKKKVHRPEHTYISKYDALKILDFALSLRPVIPDKVCGKADWYASLIRIAYNLGQEHAWTRRAELRIRANTGSRFVKPTK